MRNENIIMLKKAHELANTVQHLMLEGNMEMAHRTQAVFQSIILTILLTELIPEAAELMESFDEVPTHAADGSIVN